MMNSLWNLAQLISLPSNYWSGRRIQDGFVPDNIIIFPYINTPEKPHMGSHHGRHVLIVVTHGPVFYRVEQTIYHLESGECLLIFPYQYHYVPPTSSGEGAEAHWVACTFDVHSPSASFACMRNSPRTLRESDKELIERTIDAYHLNLPTLEIACYLSRLLLSLEGAPFIPEERRNITSTEPERERFLEAVDLALYEDIVDEGILQKLVKRTGYTQARFRFLFKKHVGISLARYIKRKRLAEAARRLLDTNVNVTEVAKEFGFRSVDVFSHTFKSVYGISPMQYRTLNRID